MKLTDYFLPYQRRWILDDARMKLYAKSRRIGITYATSFRVNDKCLRRPGTVQWVTSRDEFTAREFITDYIAKWAAAANAVCRGLAGDNAVVIDPLHGIRAYTAEYGNGSRVISLSSTPEAFAGKGGDILIDEADLHKDSGKVIDMALPCTTWGGQLEMVSALSVDGSAESPFYRMLHEAEHGSNTMGWSVHRTSILDAVEEGFVERVNEMTGCALSREEWLKRMRAKCRTEDAWRTQYLIEASEAGAALLDYGMIGSCENDAGGLEKNLLEHPKAERYAGYDVGRKKDVGVYFELTRIGDILWQSGYEVMEDMPFRMQADALARRLDDARVERLCIDATGIGMMLAEEMQERHGKYRVESVTFTGPVKASLALPVRAAFESRGIRILADDVLRHDLHKIVRSVTAAGNVRYDAGRDEYGHSDRFWALALAVHAAGRGNEVPCGIDPLPPPHHRRMENSIFGW